MKPATMLTIQRVTVTFLLFPLILLTPIVKWSLIGYSAIRDWIYIKNEGRKARKWYRENIDSDI